VKKLIVSLMFFVGFSAQASLISASVSDTDVVVGDTFELTILADMTEDFDTLGFELEFDSALFSYVDLSFSSDLTALSDLFFGNGVESYGFGFSFLNFSPLFAGEYTALTITLKALAVTDNFTFNVTNVNAAIQDIFTGSIVTQQISFDSAIAPSVNVSEAKAVSAPATLGLFAALLIAFGAIRRKAVKA
jgi:hypothetical protein